MKPLVIYHKNCADGFGAAYAAWKKLGDEAEYMPMQYDDWPLLCENGEYKFEGRDVYVLDFSFDAQQTELIIERSRSLTWLDHHKTAFENWCGAEYLSAERCTFAQERYLLRGTFVNTYIFLDMRKSGCELAWEFFHPETETPIALQHIGDRDLWEFSMIGTSKFCAALNLFDKKFVVWDSLFADSMYAEMLNTGKTLLSSQERRVKGFSDPKKLKEVSFKLPDGTELSGLACNIVSDISETGNAIAKQSGTFSMTFFVTATDVICSLRSIGDYDVTPIARLHGGGGHKNAAGFKVTIAYFFAYIWG